MYEFLPTPAVGVELNAVEKNIQSMVEGAARFGIAHRPHVKSHRSVQLAKMQIAAGAKGITCAKLGEAEVMAGAEIDDILIAYPLIGEENGSGMPTLRTCRSPRRDQRAYGAKGSPTRREARQAVEELVERDGGTRRADCCRGPRSVAERVVSTTDQNRRLAVYPGRSYTGDVGRH